MKFTRVEINFDRAANLHAYNQSSEIHFTVTHARALKFLVANEIQSFDFRIDPMKGTKATNNLLRKIESLGFSIEKTNKLHYRFKASFVEIDIDSIDLTDAVRDSISFLKSIK